MEPNISDLTDAELDRLAAIINTGKQIRALREQQVAYERGHRSRMDAIAGMVLQLNARMIELRAGGAS